MKGTRLRLALGTFVLSVLTIGWIAAPASALSPSVSSKAASNVDYTTATFNGTVNPNGLATKTYFEYGPTISYGSKTAEVSVGSGSSPLETGKGVTGLTANTTYHYRVVATNADGTSTGGDRTFYVGWNVQTAPATGQFRDVSCSSPSACTAVKNGGVERWSGTEWKAQTVAVPAGGKSVSIEAVSCPSASACTGVGTYVNGSGETKTLAETWNGTEWKVQTSPTPAGSTFIQMRSVSCPSASECTAVGTYQGNKSFAMRWNGTEWSSQTVVNPGKETYLTAVSCVSSSFCMASGFYLEGTEWIPLAERWNGTEWNLKAPVKPVGTTRSWLYDVSCVSASACWAVGPKEVVPATNETMVQFWNGSSWALQSSPNPAGGERNLESVSCTSQLFCMAVGSTTNSGLKPFGLRYDGSTWALQDLAMPAGALQAWPFAVSCIALRGCQAVGQYWNASSTIVPLAEANWRAAAPTATTTAATSVGEKSATINGTVNPNGSETKGYFEYGTTTAYGSKTAEVNFGSGSSAVEKSEALTGLSPSTTYHYRIVASNENPETSRGSDQTFATIGPPAVVTLPAAVDTSTYEAATLKGEVDPNGQSTTYQFQCGTAPGSYTITAPEPAESAGSGTTPKFASYKLTGLTKGKEYFCRITATNASGKVDGSETSFSTSPPVLTSPAGTSLGVGAKFSAVDEGEISIIGGTVSLKCSESNFEGQLAENKEGAALKGSLSTLQIKMCGSHTLSMLTLGSVEFQPTSSGNGILTSSGTEFTVLTHNVIFGFPITSHCIYRTEGTYLGTFTGSKSTGSTATLDLDEVVLPLKATDGSCGEGELEGGYSFTSPDYLGID